MEEAMKKALEDMLIKGAGSVLIIDPKTVEKLKAENSALKELVGEAIRIGQPEPVDQFHADQMDEWLAKAKQLTDEGK